MALFQVILRHKNAVLPKRATVGSAGYDLAACVDAEIPPSAWMAIDTGVALKFPEDCYCRVAPRSGLAYKHGIDVFAGVIDCDYQQNVKVILMNNSGSSFKVTSGDRIAQLIFERIYIPELEVVQQFSAAEYEHAGFGSTGF